MLAFGRFRAVKGLSHRSPLEPHNQGLFIQIHTSVLRTLRSLRIRGMSPSVDHWVRALCRLRREVKVWEWCRLRSYWRPESISAIRPTDGTRKMKRFLFGERNGVYIIDLQQTVERMEQAYAFARDTVAAGDSVFFVGTKRQAAEILEEEAKRANMFFVNQRWLGGMLTNFQTIRRSIDKMKKMEATLADPTHQGHDEKRTRSDAKRSHQIAEESVGHP